MSRRIIYNTCSRIEKKITKYTQNEHEVKRRGAQTDPLFRLNIIIAHTVPLFSPLTNRDKKNGAEMHEMIQVDYHIYTYSHISGYNEAMPFSSETIEYIIYIYIIYTYTFKMREKIRLYDIPGFRKIRTTGSRDRGLFSPGYVNLKALILQILCSTWQYLVVKNVS